MAEDLIELGLEGFDRLVDKYHDKAYETATDRAGRVWKKIRLPGRRKSVYVEQNPDAGQKPEVYDPAKDDRPAGFKKDKAPEEGEDSSSRRDDPSPYDDDYGRDRGRRESQREPVSVDERDYFGHDNLDSPRKPYPNEMPRDTYGGYPPPPPQPGTYFPPRSRAPVNDYGSPPQAGYGNPGQYLAPAAAGALYAQNQQSLYRPENRGYPWDEPPNYLERQRSYDTRPSRYESDSDFSPPRRRRTRSASARGRDRDRDRDYDRDWDRDREKRKSKDFSLGASLAGAVAGGLLGRSLGKGDLVTTVAGGVVGALGGDILADKRSSREKSQRREDRDRYSSDRYSGGGDKDYGRDYVYKDRY